MDIDFEAWLSSFAQGALDVAVRVIIALVILFISFKLINLVTRKIRRLEKFRGADKTIVKTVIYAVGIVLKCLVVIALVSYLGIDTTGITAIIASLGVGIGLAVNGALSNLAGGVLLIVTRPFRIDDFIEAQGYSGTVEDIRITCTKLITPDNKVVYIPNGALSSDNIVNYSEKDMRRLDLTFPITNRTDAELARELVLAVVSQNSSIRNTPEYSVRIKSFGQDGVELFMRAWLATGDYWTAYYDITEAVRAEFVRRGIEAPEKRINVKIDSEEHQ